MPQGERVLVTGAGGFIGSHLVELLCDRGQDVICLLMPEEDDRWIADLKVTRIRGDLTDQSSLVPALEGVATIYHLAAKMGGWSSPEYIQQVNVMGSKNLIEQCRKMDLKLKRLLFVSSMAAAGHTGAAGIHDETRAPRPANLYGRTKLFIEEYLKQNVDDIPHTTVRLPLVYGPRSLRGLPAVLKILDRGLHLTSTKSSFMVGFVTDIVRGIVRAAEHPLAVSEMFFLGEDRIYMSDEIMALAKNFLKRKALKIYIPYPVLYSIAVLSEGLASINKSNAFLRKHYLKDYFKSHWRYSPAKAEKVLGYKTHVPLPEGLRITVDWYRQFGWLKSRGWDQNRNSMPNSGRMSG